MPLWLDHAYLAVVDTIFSRLHVTTPSPAAARAARIICHRGERDDRTVLENTIPAYESLRSSGVYGIEFDVRWTRDLVPVVFHDADLRRLHGDRRRLRDLDASDLCAAFPSIPRLDTFVQRFCEEFHLMCELKIEDLPDPDLQSRRLHEALFPAEAASGYHLMCLDPTMLESLKRFPRRQCIVIGRLDSGRAMRQALDGGYAGMSCHYSTLREPQLRALHDAGQRVGVGYPDTPALVAREIARGVDWLFTNRAREARRLQLAWSGGS